MEVQFEDLREIKKMLEITKNNLLQVQSMNFDGQYFRDYLRMESLFFENGKKYYHDEELSLEGLNQKYREDLMKSQTDFKLMR